MNTQIITPNPNVWCRPGYCLEYVRNAAGLPMRYGSATEAWNNSSSQHQDWNFPAGLWVPIWFAIDIEPNGHVAWLAPDGTVWSASDKTNTPHHHPNIQDLIDYYLRWGKMTLTFLGWTEDVAGYPVVSVDISIGFDSAPPTPAPQEDTLSQAEVSQILIAVQGIVQTERATIVNEVRANTGAVGARLDKGIVISREQAEDIVAATTARVNVAVSAASAPPAVDVNALAAQLGPLLGTALGEQFITALRAQINK